MNQPGLEAADPVRVDRYSIVSCLFRGGNSRVYLAYGPDGRTPFVVKMLPRGEELDALRRERMRREADALGSIYSPRVAAVVRVDVDAAEPYIVQEYVEGPTLARVLADTAGYGLAPATVVSLALGLLEGLADIHAARVVHRDVKPSNVIVSESRGPVLLDFSISWHIGAHRLTQTNLIPMTPGYASPEQLDGKRARSESDIFSWAVVVAEAATGHHPFSADRQDLVVDRIRKGTPDLDGVPDSLRPALELSLAKDPRRRPPARRLLRELAARHRDAAVPDGWLGTLADPRSSRPLGRFLRGTGSGLGLGLRRLALRPGRGAAADWTSDRAFRTLLWLAVVLGAALGALTALVTAPWH